MPTYEETETITSIDITTQYRFIGVVVTTTVEKDGVVIAQNDTRQLFNPTADISTLPQEVQFIAQHYWTAELISEYEASLNQ